MQQGMLTMVAREADPDSDATLIMSKCVFFVGNNI
jgi:hypothetical protein